MEDTSGFYKKVSDSEWWVGIHFVYARDYTLERDGNRDNIDGWEWHDAAPQEYIIWQQSQNDEI